MYFNVLPYLPYNSTSFLYGRKIIFDILRVTSLTQIFISCGKSFKLHIFFTLNPAELFIVNVMSRAMFKYFSSSS